MDEALKNTLIEWAHEYNDPKYFQEDPIIFPTRFAQMYRIGEASLADVEISAILASHLAWGRRSIIVRDCDRMFQEMGWKPYDYVMNGEYRDENISMHRTIKWSDFSGICGRLKAIYDMRDSIEGLTDTEIRCRIFGQKEDRKAPNKKISMMRRWMCTYMIRRPVLDSHHAARRTSLPPMRLQTPSARYGRRTHVLETLPSSDMVLTIKVKTP